MDAGSNPADPTEARICKEVIMDKGVKIKTEGVESKSKIIWKNIGYGALALALALVTVLVINI